MSDEDIEDVLRLRPPIDRFRSSRTLSVTDVASQAWCEMQTGANSCGYLGGSRFEHRDSVRFGASARTNGRDESRGAAS